MKTAVVIPQLVSRANDVLGSGIFYMPISMAYLAAALREDGHLVQVHDMFALAPHRVAYAGPMLHLGAPVSELSKRLDPDTRAAFVFSWGATSFSPLIELIKEARQALPGASIVVVENSQAVFALSLSKIARPLLDAGADFIIFGECEDRARQLCRYLEGHADRPTDGLGWLADGHAQICPPRANIEDLDTLPFPAWDLFPLQTYWALGYAHGPHEGNYLSLLTSRGCSFGCRFCVIPSTNSRRWRARSADNVFREMMHWYRTQGITEFHFEDVNPTIDAVRLARLGQLIEQSGVALRWKLASGTKIETISDNTLAQMATGGCTYISFSPESGSPRVLKLIDKPFNHKHALRLVRRMRTLGVWSQAVFLLGFPGEDESDRLMSLRYMTSLVKAGLDEILVLITSPMPGAAIVEEGLLEPHSEHPGELSFSPTWRADFALLSAWQRRFYLTFFILKLLYQPARTLHHFWNVLRRKFKTKMEMTIWRLLIVQIDMLKTRLLKTGRA